MSDINDADDLEWEEEGTGEESSYEEDNTDFDPDLDYVFEGDEEDAEYEVS
jgi:hypothetical protein